MGAAVASFVVLITFMLQNTSSVEVRFLWMQGSLPLARALLIAGVAAAIVATDPARALHTKHEHDAWLLRELPLPGHVLVLVGTHWRRGRLIARDNGPTGWIGLVQYEHAGAEVTKYLPAAHIAPPDLWLAD